MDYKKWPKTFQNGNAITALVSEQTQHTRIHTLIHTQCAFKFVTQTQTLAKISINPDARSGALENRAGAVLVE